MRERAPMKTSWGDEYSISFYEVDAMLYQSRQKPFRNSPRFFFSMFEGEGKEFCRARTGWKRMNHRERDREEKYPQ